MCFHTRDAVERDDSKLTFEVPGNRLRMDAVRVTLASCEFPMVQYTIEEDFSRLYLNQGLRLDDEDARWIDVVYRRPGEDEPSSPTRILLPRRLNPIRECVWRGSRLVVECDFPHGLFSSETGRALPLKRGLTLVGSASGDHVVENGVCRVSDTAFAIESGDVIHPQGQHATHVLLPTLASPTALCEALTQAARGCLGDDVKMAFRYDASADRVLLTVASMAAAHGRLRVLPSALAQRCGLSTESAELRTTPTVWPSDPTELWDYVEMPTGFYAPCHRPMCVGQPMRFGTELEAAVNRLYFPIGKLGSASATSPHVLIFADPAGNVLSCDIPCGRYTSADLCRHLQSEMCRVARGGGVAFSVTHEEDRFTFACEKVSGDGRVTAATFGLLFHHPLSVDPARFGFLPLPHTSASSYTAPFRTRAARVEGRPITNLVRVSELAPQKRFSFHATQPPSMTAVVREGSSSELVLSTYVNSLPFAHGFRVDDVLSLSASPGATVLNVERKEVKLPPTRHELPPSTLCVVLPPHPDDTVQTLRLAAPRVTDLSEVGTTLQLTGLVEPWNLSFGKPKSIPAHAVGFPARAVQWGVDGSVEDEHGARQPPFLAPHVHCLDHPDYVIVTFSEGSGTGLEHSFDGESRHVFCKLSLYPLFREERALPRDTTLLNGNFSRFTIAFWNPDLRTPYRFHGSEFSFSLSFLSAIP